MSLLRGALLANAAFSGVSGIAFLAAGTLVAAWLGAVPPTLVRLVGVGLLAFAVVVGYQARRPARAPVAAIIVADAAWVAGSVAILTLQPAWLAPQGTVLVAAVAAAVAALALAQTMGLREPASRRAA